jgi:hypothetical protein
MTLRSRIRRSGNLLWNRARNSSQSCGVVNDLEGAKNSVISVHSFVAFVNHVSHQYVKAAIAGASDERIFNTLARLLKLPEIADNSYTVVVNISAAARAGELVF